MDGHKGMVVQERDRQLLGELAIMRVIDREQAKCVAPFRSTTRVNARLLDLVHAGLLRRFWLGTVASGRKAIYALSAKGAALVGAPRRGPRRRNDETIATDAFVAHQLEINEVYCRIKYGQRPNGIELVRWLVFHEPLRANLLLIPDGYFELETPHGYLCGFLEVDRTTESLAHWKKKIQNYLQFATSGDFEKQFAQEYFRVFVVANSPARMHSIRRMVAGKTDKIFRLAMSDVLKARGFFEIHWLRPKANETEILDGQTT